MNETYRRPLGAATLDGPRLAAIAGPQNCAALTGRPAIGCVKKMNGIQRQRLAGRLSLPGQAEVGAVPDDRARPTDNPNSLIETSDALEIEQPGHGWREMQVSEAPPEAGAVLTQEHESALPDRHAALAGELYPENTPATEFVNVGGTERSVAHRGEPAPRAAQRTGIAVEKIGRPPSRAAGAGGGGPVAPAV